MRGALSYFVSHFFNSGIIPADAGSTRFSCRASCSTEDHPRGCGEHISTPKAYPPSVGSSPRMRGAHRACMSMKTWMRDHPRGCGEHLLAIDFPPCLPGSSPRMRGAPIGIIEDITIGRIIPADAGSTEHRRCIMNRIEDHPRGCGEHRQQRHRRISPAGSSPRMRGALHKLR